MSKLKQPTGYGASSEWRSIRNIFAEYELTDRDARAAIKRYLEVEQLLGKKPSSLAEENKRLREMLQGAVNFRNLTGLELIVDDSLRTDRPAQLINKSLILRKDRLYHQASIQLSETLAIIKVIGAMVDIPQSHERAVQLLEGKDKDLGDQWDTVRGILLQEQVEIPEDIPAVIAARKEALSTFLQTQGLKWQPLWEHVKKTAEFGLEDLPALNEYHRGGAVGGRAWLAERWFAIKDEEPDLPPGGIYRRIKAELEAEDLPEYEYAGAAQKKKIRALKTLRHYKYERAGKLEVVLRRVAKTQQKLTMSEHVPTV